MYIQSHLWTEIGPLGRPGQTAQQSVMGECRPAVGPAQTPSPSEGGSPVQGTLRNGECAIVTHAQAS